MRRLTLVPFVLGSLLAGCGTAPEADDASVDEAAVGQTSSALCTDAGAANYSAALGGEGSSVTRTSPSRTYGSAACSGLYVVEATNTLGKSFQINANWGEALPNTEQACPFALLTATAYGYKNGVWTNLGTKSAGGQWTTFFDSGFCSIGVGWSQVNSQYTKVRIASKAAAFLLFSASPRKVKGTIEIPSVPR
jgi:hypothetical protein